MGACASKPQSSLEGPEEAPAHVPCKTDCNLPPVNTKIAATSFNTSASAASSSDETTANSRGPVAPACPTLSLCKDMAASPSPSPNAEGAQRGGLLFAELQNQLQQAAPSPKQNPAAQQLHEHHKSQLSQELEVLSAANGNLQEWVNSLETSKNQLAMECEGLQAQVMRMADTETKLRGVITKQEAQLSVLQGAHADKDEALSQLRAELDAARSLLKEREAAVSQLQAAHQAALGQVALATAECAAQRGEASQLAERSLYLQDLVHQMQVNAAQRLAEAAGHEAALAAAERRAIERATARAAAQAELDVEAQARAADLHSKIAQLQAALDKSEEANRILKDEAQAAASTDVGQLRAQLAAAHATQIKLEAKAGGLEKLNIELGVYASDMEGCNQALEARVAEVVTATTLATTRMAEMQLSVQQAHAQAEDLRAALRESERARAAAEDARAGMESKVAELQAALQEREDELVTGQAALQASLTELSCAKLRVDDLQVQRDALNVELAVTRLCESNASHDDDGEPGADGATDGDGSVEQNASGDDDEEEEEEEADTVGGGGVRHLDCFMVARSHASQLVARSQPSQFSLPLHLLHAVVGVEGGGDSFMTARSMPEEGGEQEEGDRQQVIGCGGVHCSARIATPRGAVKVVCG